MTFTTCPRPLNHIGISVPDIDRAIAWYGEVLGYRLFSGPFDLVASPPALAQFQDALGERCQHVRIAHLSTGGGVGIELFQPVLPATQPGTTDIRFDQPGPFHICVTDPDIEGLIGRIVATGGTQTSRIWDDRPHRAYTGWCTVATRLAPLSKSIRIPVKSFRDGGTESRKRASRAALLYSQCPCSFEKHQSGRFSICFL